MSQAEIPSESRQTRRIRIEHATTKEAAAIEKALTDPEVRAFAVVVGILSGLNSDRARQRLLRYVADQLDEENARR